MMSPSQAKLPTTAVTNDHLSEKVMRRILLCISAVLFSVILHAQDNPVVMDVNGYEVRKSEFEYFFRKNNTETSVTRKTVRQYADLYLNFKLKVQAALDEGLDKSQSFLNEYRMYRDMQAEDYLIDKDFLEEVTRNSYDQSVLEVGPDGLVHLSVISSTPREETLESLGKSVELLESVYKKLEAGEPFSQLAKEYSDDQLAATGGEAGWVARFQLPDDVAEIVFSLEDGQFSRPFVSEGMAFIVKVDGHRQLDAYEEVHDQIYRRVLESEALPEARRRAADKYATKLGWSNSGDEAVAHLDSVLEDVEPDFGNISREYYDGLLLFDISNREIWEKVSSDPEALDKYYQSHKKQYRFDPPAFKGMVIFCKDEETFNELKSKLDGVGMDEWIDSILEFNKSDIKVRVMKGSSETGVFRQGQNAYVDKIVFGKGEYEPMPNYPYVNVLGRVIKEPDTVQDVIADVTEGYQNQLESEWIKKLRKQYRYKIFRKALKQVSLDL